METPDGKVFIEKPKGERLGPRARAILSAVRSALRALVAGLWRGVVLVARAAGKFAITTWRLAGALDSALWRALKYLSGRLSASAVYCAGLIARALHSLLLWLPTRTGRAYSASSGVVLALSFLWIADELRAGPAAGKARGEESGPPIDLDDPILARIEGRYIHLSEIETAARSSGALGADDVLTPVAAFERGLVESYVERRLLAKAAQNEGLHRAPEVLRRVNAARDEILAATLVQSQVEGAVTPEAVNRYYLAQRQLITPGQEVRARHIIVETEAEAQEIRAALEAGADFADLARSRSLDPATAPLGGEMGWFSRAVMSPALANAAFDTPLGEVSAPVFSEHGWHLLEVVESRRRPAKPLSAVEQDIAEFMRMRVVGDMLTELASKSQVAYYRPQIDFETSPPPRMPGADSAAVEITDEIAQ